MKSVPIDKANFEYGPYLGEHVMLWEIPKSKLMRGDVSPFGKNRRVTYMVTSLSPLLAKPVLMSIVTVAPTGEHVSVRTRSLA